MYKPFLALFFLLFSCVVAAQNDTLKIQNLMNAAYSLEQPQPAKALQLYQKTFKLSLKENYKDGAYKSLLYSGLVHSNIGQYDSAFYHFNKTILFCKKNNIPIGIAKAHANIANTYQYKGDYNAAIKQYLLAIKTFEKLKDSLATSVSYQNLSAIYNDYQNEKLQFYYLKKAEQYLSKSNFVGLGFLYGDIGIGYLKFDKLPEALTYFRKAEQMSKKDPITNSSLQFYVVRNFGEYYRISKKYERAIPFYEEASKLSDLAIDLQRKCDLLRVMSDLYLQINNYPKALALATESLTLAKKINAKEIEFKSLKTLAVIYSKINQPQKAYELLEKSDHIKDSIFSDENSKELALLQTQFETEKKDKSIAEQQIKLKEQGFDLIKNQKQKQLYFVSIVLLTLLLLGIWYFFKQRQKLKNKEIETLKQNQEITNLEALIDGEEKERKRIAQELHDGLNSDLSAIKYRLSALEESVLSAIDTENLAKVINMIDESCAQVRSISHNLMPASILEYGLIESVRAYCLKINNSNDFKIEFQSFGNSVPLSKKTETVIYRIIQELVANIVKHARATEAMIQFNFREDEIFITVEDNGIGFDTTKIYNGIGHKNIQTRVNFLNAQIDVDSSANGTSFTISIDINKLK